MYNMLLENLPGMYACAISLLQKYESEWEFSILII